MFIKFKEAVLINGRNVMHADDSEQDCKIKEIVSDNVAICIKTEDKRITIPMSNVSYIIVDLKDDTLRKKVK